MISPHQQLQFAEPGAFADQTVRQVLHQAGGGEAFRVRRTNLYGALRWPSPLRRSTGV
ncbi:hypothetical protein V1634_28455 [Plantactinospora veratri]|uniref:Uncharacterized protein n=1 Tax=Plantactinospora veratri TaxID=1436122 RepID=A0ABU7SLH3_9ACTN